jgi:tRNA 2-thiouridine synthesizing protein A
MLMPMREREAPMHIDATGLTCPLPVLRLQKALRGLPPATTICLHATDPMARIDVPHFLREHGHVLVETTAKPEAAPGGLTLYEFVICTR